MTKEHDLWVFGYGSLLWKTGFEYAERRLATLRGFSRSFCMSSIHYRGTPEAPGLVLALDPDPNASCDGVAFRVEHKLAETTLAYLRERELISSAYVEQFHPVNFHSGGQAEAVCYVINHDHAQYRGGLTLDQQAVIIANAEGSTGKNWEYLANTVAHLDEMKISDLDLTKLAEKVKKAVQT